MPPELAAAPFEPPRPLPGTGSSNGDGHRKSAGTGLGLSIAKGIVQAHGGRIELIPLPKGTCFQVYLPVEADADASRTAGPGPGASGSGAAAGGRTVLSERGRDGDDG